MVNDYGAVATGTWATVSIWRQWDGLGWNTIPVSFPNSSTTNVYILAGNQVTLTASPMNVANLYVQTGARLFAANPTSNLYVTVWGSNIVCDGDIGGGLASFDGIAFNFEGPTCTITGLGTFVASRFRKSASTNPVTTLTIGMNVTLKWDQASNTQLYNNATGSTRFNVTINAGSTLNCLGSALNPGNVSLDDVSGAGTEDAGGTITVNGTLVVTGILYASTNNPRRGTTTATGNLGSTTITVASATGLAIGQGISGTGIASGATITNIVGTTITLSAANTGAVSGTVNIFNSQMPSVTGLSGQSTVTVGSASGLSVGQTISGTNIAAGATITAISGNTLTLSAANTGTVSGQAMVGNACNFNVGTSGLIRTSQVNSPAGYALGMMNFTVGQGVAVNNNGKLELTGANAFNTATWSTTNNRYNFERGSTVEYSYTGNQSVLCQTNFLSTTNYQYWNLNLSGSGNKTLFAPTVLTVRGNLTISGSAVMDQAINSPDIAIGGNWINWGQQGFNQSLITSKKVNFIGNGTSPTTPTQTITCPGGEIFTNLAIYKSTGAPSSVRLQNPVTVTNQLQLGTLNGNAYGILDLNKNPLTITNPSTSGILLSGNQGYFRYIISEDSTNAAMVNWKIDTAMNALNAYVVPFGINTSSDTIPFVFYKTTSDSIGTLSVATYATPANNKPWPSSPVAVTNLWANNPIYNNPDNRDWTVDRFWYVGATNPISNCNAVFVYNNRSTTELPTADPVPANLLAQYWNAGLSSWQMPPVGTASPPGVPVGAVMVQSFPAFNTAWTLTSSTSPLPVSLLHFSARNDGEQVLTTWTTASEINNDFFIVERSADGRSFEPIGKVAGAGTSTLRNSYRFYDTHPLNGISYYRLKQTDFDGRYSYSDIAAVERNNNKISFSAFPNPATDHTSILSNGQLSGTYNVTIADYSGRCVFSTNFDLSVSKELDVDLSGYASGVYELMIEGISANGHFRLVKQ